MAEKSLTEHYLRSLEADNERLEAENKRLREALEHIKEYWNGNPESAVDAIEEAIHTAEQALEGGGSDVSYLWKYEKTTQSFK